MLGWSSSFRVGDPPIAHREKQKSASRLATSASARRLVARAISSLKDGRIAYAAQEGRARRRRAPRVPRRPSRRTGRARGRDIQPAPRDEVVVPQRSDAHSPVASAARRTIQVAPCVAAGRLRHAHPRRDRDDRAQDHLQRVQHGQLDAVDHRPHALGRQDHPRRARGARQRRRRHRVVLLRGRREGEQPRTPARSATGRRVFARV
jgi:hypothetical protein